MEIQFDKKFIKRFDRLSVKDQKRVRDSIDVFRKKPQDPALRNHALKGVMERYRAISVRADLRIIFIEYENYTLVVFIDVGSHNQVYR